MIDQGVSEQSAKIAVEALLFELAGQRFAMPLSQVLEIVRAVAVRPLPAAPSITLGIIDLRGEIVPVFDVRARFHLASKPLELADQFIIVQAGRRKAALHVDRALGLMQLSMLPAGRAQNLVRSLEHLAGIASTDEGLVLIHDLETFLTQAEIATLDAALEASRTGAESSAR